VPIWRDDCFNFDIYFSNIIRVERLRITNHIVYVPYKHLLLNYKIELSCMLIVRGASNLPTSLQASSKNHMNMDLVNMAQLVIFTRIFKEHEVIMGELHQPLTSHPNSS
jgi:hypothetical protein